MHNWVFFFLKKISPLTPVHYKTDFYSFFLISEFRLNAIVMCYTMLKFAGKKVKLALG